MNIEITLVLTDSELASLTRLLRNAERVGATDAAELAAKLRKATRE